MRAPSAIVFGTTARTARATSRPNRMRFSSEPPYWSVRLLETGDRKRMRQIAVRVVQLDRVEADPHRALGGIDEGRRARARCRPRRLARHVPVRRRTGSPTAPIVCHGSSLGLERPAALPGPLRRGLAAGVRDLDAELGGADAAAVRDHARQRRLVVVGIEPDAAVGDAAVPLDMRSPRRSPGRRRNSPACRDGVMCQSVGAAVVGAVLAHRRDHDAVGEFDAGRA